MRRLIGRFALPAFVAACAVLLLASGPVAADDQPEIHMRDNAYVPDSVTVPVGTTVRWVNDDGDIHTVSQQGGGFESGLLFSHDAWTYTFDTPGVYEYTCLPHPYMHGTITVQ